MGYLGSHDKRAFEFRWKCQGETGNGYYQRGGSLFGGCFGVGVDGAIGSQRENRETRGER